MSILYLNETIQVEQFKLNGGLSVQARLMPSRPSTWALQMVESRHSPQTVSALILHQNVIMMHMKCI